MTFENTKMQGFIKPKDKLDSTCTDSNYLRVISEISHSGKPNYLGRRIELGSSFHLALWEKRLKHYEDKQVVNLLRYGFPLGICDRTQLTSSLSQG